MKFSDEDVLATLAGESLHFNKLTNYTHENKLWLLLVVRREGIDIFLKAPVAHGK